MAERHHFDRVTEEVVRAVETLFGVQARVEPFTPDGTPVYRIEPAGAADGISMVLWLSLSRVDVTSTGHHAWTLKDIGSVEVIEGVEVVFHPASGRGFLFVAPNGWINMVIG